MEDLEFFQAGLAAIVNGLHRTRNIQVVDQGIEKVAVSFNIGLSRVSYEMSYDFQTQELRVYSLSCGNNVPEHIAEGLNKITHQKPERTAIDYAWKGVPFKKIFSVKEPEDVSFFLLYDHFLQHNPVNIQNWEDLKISRDELSKALLEQRILSTEHYKVLHHNHDLLKYFERVEDHYVLTDYGIGQYRMIVDKIDVFKK